MTDSCFVSGRKWWKQEENWIMPTKNLREISSLRLARVLRYVADNIDKFKMVWMALSWRASNYSIWALVQAQCQTGTQYSSTCLITVNLCIRQSDVLIGVVLIVLLLYRCSRSWSSWTEKSLDGFWSGPL